MVLEKVPYFKPTINLKASNPSYAVYGHIVSIIGGFFMIVSGFLKLLDEPLGAVIGVLGGIIILVVEFDEVHVPLLKEAVNRGAIWIVLGAISFGLHLLPIILIFVGGTFYLVYNYQS